jgi:hypothetical protein
MPSRTVKTRFKVCVYKDFNALAKDIENLQSDHTLELNGILNQGRRIEWIWIILFQDK